MTELICITCPTGCLLHVERTGDSFTISGNECKRGVDFAQAELTRPLRTLCSTVRTNRGVMLPVRTDRDIPKEKISEVMRLIAKIIVEEHVKCGEIIAALSPICDGNIIATSNLMSNF